jgi:hypothetical protein
MKTSMTTRNRRSKLSRFFECRMAASTAKPIKPGSASWKMDWAFFALLVACAYGLVLLWRLHAISTGGQGVDHIALLDWPLKLLHLLQ